MAAPTAGISATPTIPARNTAQWQGDAQTRALTVQVVLHRRNTFGPLHQFPLKQPYTAPDSFLGGDVNRYALYPTRAPGSV